MSSEAREAQAHTASESMSKTFFKDRIASIRTAVLSIVGLAALSAGGGLFVKLHSDMRQCEHKERAESLAHEAHDPTTQFLLRARHDPSKHPEHIADALLDLGTRTELAFAEQGIPMDSVILWQRALQLYEKASERLLAQDFSLSQTGDAPDAQQHLTYLHHQMEQCRNRLASSDNMTDTRLSASVGGILRVAWETEQVILARERKTQSFLAQGNEERTDR